MFCKFFFSHEVRYLQKTRVRIVTDYAETTIAMQNPREMVKESHGLKPKIP